MGVSSAVYSTVGRPRHSSVQPCQVYIAALMPVKVNLWPMGSSVPYISPVPERSFQRVVLIALPGGVGGHGGRGGLKGKKYLNLNSLTVRDFKAPFASLL